MKTTPLPVENVSDNRFGMCAYYRGCGVKVRAQDRHQRRWYRHTAISHDAIR